LENNIGDVGNEALATTLQKNKSLMILYRREDVPVRNSELFLGPN